jgi:precorrin-2 dehydrogenase/sirohydrochlorin ferrochelatase
MVERIMVRQECTEDDEDALLPLFLDLSTRLVVIFGGGAVGQRKAELFSRYGPVRVCSLDFSEGLLELAAKRSDRMETIRCDLYAGLSHHLQGAFLAVPATGDSSLNQAIEEECKARGILVNRVEGRGEVVVPSIIRRGTVSIAISTQIPALSRYLRLRLEEQLGENISEMARLLSSIRQESKARIPLQKDRAAAIRQILEDREVWRLLDLSYEKAYIRALSHIRPDERDSLDAGDPPQGLDRRD